jgi:hypothetical protein
MHFNADRIAQLAGLAPRGETQLREDRTQSGVLSESARPAGRATSTYDRVVEELQLRGLELFYTPAQINEAIRHEARLLREEKEMEDEAKACPKCGKRKCECGMEEGYEGDEGMHEIMAEMDDMVADEGHAVGTTITEPDGTVTKVVKAGAKTSMAESKVARLIQREVDSVLREMANSGDTAWMYPNGKKPAGKKGNVTLGFAGTGFKR